MKQRPAWALSSKRRTWLRCGCALPTHWWCLSVPVQRFFGTAVGKGRQGAKNEIEKLKLEEMSCREGIQAVAKM